MPTVPLRPERCIVADDGYATYNIWAHSTSLRELYRQRARDEAEEMTCAAQAAELLSPRVAPGDCVLDIGCGSGHFFHSLRRRNIDARYHGIDATACLVDIGRAELPRFGLPADRLHVCRIEDFRGTADHVVCINVLSNIDNYHKPLERLLHAAQKTLILRESLAAESSTLYVRDRYLDDGVDLGVYVNTYAIGEVMDFIRERGFAVETVVDRRTGGRPENVIGHPHHWTFLVATKARAVPAAGS